MTMQAERRSGEDRPPAWLHPVRPQPQIVRFARKRPIVTAILLYALWLAGWAIYSWAVVVDHSGDRLLMH